MTRCSNLTYASAAGGFRLSSSSPRPSAYAMEVNELKELHPFVLLLVLAVFPSRGTEAGRTSQYSDSVPSSPQATTGECDVTPRSSKFFDDLVTTEREPVSSPSSSPRQGTLPTGSPVPEELILAITRTMEQIIACSNAGDFARVATLFTDDYWRREARSPAVGQSFADAVATPPTRVPAAEREELVAIRDVRLLADGRVGAVVVLSNARDADPDPDVVIFEKVGEAWLVDEVIAGIDTAGTPAA